MMWVDYFLQVFVAALAWCLAITLVGTLIGAIWWVWLKAFARARARAAILRRMRAGR